jgi:enoyl-CoA hydratase/carnithine racemase
MTTSKRETGTDHVVCEVAGHIATITLNRPEKRNAIGVPEMQALGRALELAEEDQGVRVVVLTGAGSAFCAGGDITGMGGNLGDAGLQDKIDGLRELQEITTLRLYEVSKPTIAALPGVAAGAGMSLALACDLRIAVDGAGFVPAFGAIGASGDFGGSWLLSRMIGPGRAKEVYFTGRRIETEEATRLGLFNRVADLDGWSRAVEELAKTLAAQAPVALRHMKDNHNRAQIDDLRTSLSQEADRMMRCLHTEDHKQAVEAFFAKRPPVFNGR